MKGGTEWLANRTDGGSDEAEDEWVLDRAAGVTVALTSALSSCPMACRARFTLLSSSSWLRKAERSGKWTSPWPMWSFALPFKGQWNLRCEEEASARL